MQGFIARVSTVLCFALWSGRLVAQEGADRIEAIVSVADQRLMVIRDGMWTHKFPISTSKFGLGDSFRSYKTPIGRLRVCDKIGAGLPVGSVIKHRNATGEILPVNAPGRDPIVTRILWLEGLEQSTANARSRGIYIHGTVEESRVGDPVSYGCIRMKSRDVIELFDLIPVGTEVRVQTEKLPRLRRWSPPPPEALIAANHPAKPSTERSSPLEPVGEKLDAPRTATAPPPKLPKTALVRPSAASRLVINSSRDADPSNMAPSALHAGDAFKGSILFSDLPGHGPKLKRVAQRSSSLDSLNDSTLSGTSETR